LPAASGATRRRRGSLEGGRQLVTRRNADGFFRGIAVDDIASTRHRE
jgi:hypothetical protein